MFFFFLFIPEFWAIFWQIMHQKSWIMQIGQYWAIFWCFNLWNLQIFFGFSKLSIFKAKTCIRKLFCCIINQSTALFSFPSCDWWYFFQSWHMYKKPRAWVPTASSIKHPECLVDLQYLWMLFATKRWLFAVKMYYIYGQEISMDLSKYGKRKTAY